MFGVVDDTTTTKFANRACAVHGISLPVVVDKVVVVVLKFPNVLPIQNNVATMSQRCVALKIVVANRLV